MRFCSRFIAQLAYVGAAGAWYYNYPPKRPNELRAGCQSSRYLKHAQRFAWRRGEEIEHRPIRSTPLAASLPGSRQIDGDLSLPAWHPTAPVSFRSP